MSSGSSATRWIVLVVAMGGAGWAAYTVHERGLMDTPISAEPPKDGRLDGFVDEGHQKLVAGQFQEAEEQLHKASGIDDDDERVQEGLVLVQVERAERVWWKLRMSAPDDPAKKELVATLDGDVDRARQAIAVANNKVQSASFRARLKLYERRLNTMVVIAFAEIGDRERAQGALNARLAGDPQFEMLQTWLRGDVAPAGSASAAASASAAPSASSEFRPNYGEVPHEFDDEPRQPPKSPGELEIPAPPDTSDLP